MKSRRVLAIVCCLFLAVTLCPAPRAQTPEATFTSNQIKTDEIDNFCYWLYTPQNPTENMPLIVYLHGGSGKGEDLSLITNVEGFPRYLQDGRIGDLRAYVVMPQLATGKKGKAEDSKEKMAEFHQSRLPLVLGIRSVVRLAAWASARPRPLAADSSR